VWGSEFAVKVAPKGEVQKKLLLGLEAAEDQKTKIYVYFRCFVTCIPPWGLERTNPTQAGRKTARMANRINIKITTAK